MLAAVIEILTASEDSPMLNDTDQEDVSEAITFLAERLATTSALIENPKVSVNMLELVPRGDGGRRKGPAKSMLIDVARGLARRVPLTKLIALDSDIRPYLASLMVAALHRAKDKLVVPNDLEIKRVTREQFDLMLQKEAGRTYDNYGTIATNLLDAKPQDQEALRQERLESQLEKISEAVTWLIGVRQAYDNEEIEMNVGAIT